MGHNSPKKLKLEKVPYFKDFFKKGKYFEGPKVFAGLEIFLKRAHILKVPQFLQHFKDFLKKSKYFAACQR